MVKTVQTFLVVSTIYGAWGIADNLKEAIKNCKRNSDHPNKQRLTVILFDCPKNEVSIEADVSMRYRCAESVTVMRFETEM